MDNVIAPTVAAAVPAIRQIDVAAVIDQHPMGPLQIQTVVLCGLTALLDGFDLLAVGVAAPAMAEPLRIAPDQLGTLFSAALLGLMLGAFGLGPVADRIGRRSVLIGATTMFGIFTLSTAAAATLHQVLLFRFLAGVGLGGAMPGFISLAAEYTPRRWRRQIVALLWAGFPLGGVMVGLLASRLLPIDGWRILFVIGGTLPLGLTLLLLCMLPESMAFLVSRGAPAQRVRNLLARIIPEADIHLDTRFIGPVEPRGTGVRALFQFGRGRTTALLWGSYFTTFLMLITSTAWVPTLLERTGIGRAEAAAGTAWFALGSAIGTPLAGLLLARFEVAKLLAATLLLGAVAISALGLATPSFALVLACLICAGFCLGAASSGLIALTPLLYSTRVRSTAVGWAMGWGRAGSFAGPLAIGMLVSSGWTVPGTLAALGLPGLVGAMITAWLGRTTLAPRHDRDQPA